MADGDLNKSTQWKAAARRQAVLEEQIWNEQVKIR